MSEIFKYFNADELMEGTTNVVLVAMANKTARTVWAMMRNQQDFNVVFR